jgi:hypothetical protein
MNFFDKGKVVVIEAIIQKYEPFETYTDSDPTAITITITEQDGTVKVSAELMIKDTTGHYYYECQTDETWEAGEYKAKVDITDGVSTDTQTASIFGLK